VEKATKRSRELPEDRGRAGLGNKDKPSLLTVQLSPSTIASVDRQQGVTMSTVPTGTVSFLFTDIEGSTRLGLGCLDAVQQRRKIRRSLRVRLGEDDVRKASHGLSPERCRLGNRPCVSWAASSAYPALIVRGGRAIATTIGRRCVPLEA